MTSGARSALGAGVAAGVILAGYGAWLAFGPQGAEVAPPAEVVAAPQALPEVSEAAAPEAAAPETVAPEAPAAADAQPEPPAQVAPAFDIVRIAPDGSATVAGTAAPGMTLSMRIDGVEVASTVADGSGQFASLFTLDASKAPRLLSLFAVDANGAEISAAGTVAVAPIFAAAQEAAAALPEPRTAAAAEAPPAAEPEPPAALLLTDEGAVVLQEGAAPPAAALAAVSVDTITYTAEGRVQLGGRGAGGAFIRFYLDDAAIAALTVPPNGKWLTTLGDVAPGIYKLRADQLGPDGKVISRFETPFKRETLEALALAAAPDAAREAAPVAESAAPEIATAEAAPQVVAAPESTPESTPEPVPESAPSVAAIAPEAPPAAAPPDPAAPAALAAAEAPPAEAAAPADPVPPAPPEAPATVEPAAPRIALADPPAAAAPAGAEVEAAPALPAAADPASTSPAAAAPPEAAPEAAPAPTPPVTVTVQPGFTLWRIARENFGDGVLYVQVFEANKDKIRDPDLIYPGQVFTLPGSGPNSGPSSD